MTPISKLFTKQNKQKHAIIPDGDDTIKTLFVFFLLLNEDAWNQSSLLEREQPQCNVGAKKKKKRGADQKKKEKVKSLALFMMVNLWQSKLDLCGRSAGRQRERNFITVLGTKNAGKNEISEYLFFFIHILFINNTSFTFVCMCVCVWVFLLYKRLQNEKRV